MRGGPHSVRKVRIQVRDDRLRAHDTRSQACTYLGFPLSPVREVDVDEVTRILDDWTVTGEHAKRIQRGKSLEGGEVRAQVSATPRRNDHGRATDQHVT